MDTKQLNKPELQIMKCLWEIDKGFLKDIVEQFPEPKPAYTTISTLLGRMCDKGYVGFEKLGRDKRYFPLLKKNVYSTAQIKSVINNFFNGSPTLFASYFTKNTDLSIEELKDLKGLLEEEIKSKKE
ncbi:MAG: BlaI/MecI/CopY family transcriptional regulator [Cyclobacteriaceae bacterium]|nr:BlaI/MecI/CopY family transcriptional regulator [Cyclobacteriaceae bacterium]